jgi:nicotinate phosphoribosyltransferase
MGMFHTAGDAQIVSGKTTDAYFERTLRILRTRRIHRRVSMEVRAAGLPKGWSWAVLAGVEEALRLLSRLRRRIEVESAAEGAIFRAGDPVMYVSGDYVDLCVFETPLLGMLCQASGIATTAARCRKAAGQKQLLSFGARRMHPAISPMIERAAFIGGCDGVACVAGARLIGETARGTMPHALVLCVGDTVEAARLFHAIIPAETAPTVVLIDTFQDEKFEAIRVADALGAALAAVRLDTPGSRRGDFRALLKEVRWELDLRGHRRVKLFVSGGINESTILELRDLADGFGVGTHISNAPTVDFAMDIVEMDGRPLAKRGKLSGLKTWWQHERTLESSVVPRAAGQKPPGPGWRRVLQPAIRAGQAVGRLPGPQQIRKRVLAQLEHVRLE